MMKKSKKRSSRTTLSEKKPIDRITLAFQKGKAIDEALKKAARFAKKEHDLRERAPKWLKPAPRSKSGSAERTFWNSNDSSNVVDWSKAKRVSFPNLKTSMQSILLRLPVHLLERIKVAANTRGVPYQSLIKIWLEEKLSM